jgi:hypothetical protein
VRCEKKLKLISDGGDCGTKKCKRGYGGVWRSLRLAVGFVLVRLAKIYSSHREDVFTFNLVVKKFYLQAVYSVQFLSFHLLYGLVLYNLWFSVGNSFQCFVFWFGLS